MTYNIFIEIAAIACCVYTAFRFGLYLYNKVYSNKKEEEPVPVATEDPISVITEEPVSVTTNELDKQIELLESLPIPPIEDDYIGSVTLSEVEYSDIYLDNRPIVNRTQVYISKDNHTHIRRFLAVVAPNASFPVM